MPLSPLYYLFVLGRPQTTGNTRLLQRIKAGTSALIMVEIAVIGAGAAGLVASRHLIRCGLRPCIFEASTNGVVGGTWNAASKSYKMWDNLIPNLSRHTCVFSDYLWPDAAPTFPSRLDVHNYLDRYANTYLEPEYFRYGCTVTSVKRCNPITNSTASLSELFSKQIFQVEWTEEGETNSREFDGVIVATGFFSTPFLPEGLDATARGFIHSSEYRSNNDYTNKSVAVIGASFSALEIAADVRKHASKVISILPRIPYVMPRYVPMPIVKNETIRGFVPLDTVLYRRSQEAPQIPASVAMTDDVAVKKHAFLQQLQGSRKQRQSPLGLPEDDKAPPLVAISDDYLNLVIDGNIHVVRGRVTKVTSAEKNQKEIVLEDGTTLDQVDSVIACTGYQSQLDFLEPEILNALKYDQDDRSAPLTLCYDAFHPKVPGLGFVGMYKGPYFGVMDLQARLLAGLFSREVDLDENSISEALAESQEIRKIAASNRAHFPRYDYVGFMDALASQLKLVPPGAYGATGAVVSPPHYQPSENIAAKCQAAIDQEFLVSKDANIIICEGSVNMARVALSALIGKWKFERTITQFNTKDAPQRVTGTIDFSHILPPKKVVDSNDSTKQEWNNVLYDESGIFNIAGKELEVFRKYEYEYKDDGSLEIYFVEYGKRAHLFLSLKFSKVEEDGYWIATNDHLCIKDLYSATFKIAFDGISARHVTMNYRVRGPNKDYESVTHLLPCNN